MSEIREYCLNCINKPCSNNGCPLNNDIPGFIHEKDIKKAYEILTKTTVLPAICGRICPHFKQCQGSCIRGIKGEPVPIGEMESKIADKAVELGYKIPKDIDKELICKNVAVVGSGPAGLTCAGFLARKGVNVTIYEKYDKLGGLLSHGIPEFRLDSNVLKKSIEQILKIGNINVELNKELGKDFSLQELREKYDAIFISIGANIPLKMNVKGENLEGVYSGNGLLEYDNHPTYTNKKVAIIGGGNVAIDTARTINRMNARQIYVIYRRAEEQMPAEKKEIEEAKKEGIEFLLQTNITKIIGNERVEKIECIKTKLINKEGETRLSPVNIEGSNYLLDIDYVVLATGARAEFEVIKDFEKNEKGYIKVNTNMETSIKNVYAGGDVAGEKRTVAWAARSGRNAAESIINNFLENC